jgi:hypothetical protein
MYIKRPEVYIEKNKILSNVSRKKIVSCLSILL